MLLSWPQWASLWTPFWIFCWVNHLPQFISFDFLKIYCVLFETYSISSFSLSLCVGFFKFDKTTTSPNLNMAFCMRWSLLISLVWDSGCYSSFCFVLFFFSKYLGMELLEYGVYLYTYIYVIYIIYFLYLYNCTWNCKIIF